MKNKINKIFFFLSHKLNFSKIELLGIKYSFILNLYLNFNFNKLFIFFLFKKIHSDTFFFKSFFFFFLNNLFFFLSNTSFHYIIKFYNLFLDNDLSLKFQFLTYDNFCIETVFIKNSSNYYKNSLCISSQIGCVIGCSFCSVSKLKFIRNLMTSEIILQIYLVSYSFISYLNIFFSKINYISNIIFMGVGEPLNNYINVYNSINILNCKNSLSIYNKNITLSTSGIIKFIYIFLFNTNCNLSISLNHSSNADRKKIMSLSKKWNIFNLSNFFFLDIKKASRINYTYIIISGLNDSILDCIKIFFFLKKCNSKINLIFYNFNFFSDFSETNLYNILFFKKFLLKNKIKVYFRNEHGKNINGSCGTLSYDYIYRKRYN